jgi:thiamine-phosphate pyrophosphorylase
LRHALAEALGRATSLAIFARDTAGDIGTSINLPAEYTRHSVADIAVAAAKRTGEALRVIEEFGKIIDEETAPRIEALRYRWYDLERRIAAATKPRDALAVARLYVLITESLCRNNWLQTAEASLDGGADIIQLREKSLNDHELLRRAKCLASLCRERGAVFIVNDRADIAVASSAHGLHVGQDDLQIPTVRRILRTEMMAGISTHTVEQATIALDQSPDYIAVGPMFDTDTKPQDHIAGVDTLRAVRSLTCLPIVAIGGITPENAPIVVAAGADCLCVCNAVIASEDPKSAARTLKNAFQLQPS